MRHKKGEEFWKKPLSRGGGEFAVPTLERKGEPTSAQRFPRERRERGQIKGMEIYQKQIGGMGEMLRAGGKGGERNRGGRKKKSHC